MAEILAEKQELGDTAQTKQLQQLESRIESLSNSNEIKLNNIRETVEKRLEYIQQDNNKNWMICELLLMKSCKNYRRENDTFFCVGKRTTGAGV